MADVPITPTQAAPSKNWLRQYPPLATLVVALLIAFLVLPSALNLPQSSPSTVLEFAPVPPEDDTPPPQDMGSLSALSLGTTSSLADDITPPPASGPTGGEGRAPTQKRCVGDPPRQTEDPNSPPCVGFWDADNGGNTWQGVTADTITALIYHTGGTISTNEESEGGDTSAGEQIRSGVYCDLDRPSSEQPACQDSGTNNELSAVRAMRALARYFNERYQTYDRRVHFWIYFAAPTQTPASRRANAQDNWEALRPFGVIDVAQFGGHNEAYADAAARRHIMVFGSFGLLPNSFYRELAPMIWSFWPDVERDVELFSSYICQRIAGHKVSRAGDSKAPGQNFNGQDRVYGFVTTRDQRARGHQRFSSMVAPKLAECGVVPADSRSIPETGWTNDNGGDRTYADNNMASFKDAGVTTIIWMAGMEPKSSRAARRALYFPEWILHGDRHNDDLINGRAQEQSVWAHAWTATSQLREDRFANTPGRQAYREADPGGRQVVEYYATLYYRDMFTMMRSIQVAGPFLSPLSVDQGNHAIPRYRSETPYAAACFYDPNDYSCAKDAQESWWDPDAPDPNGDPVRGCWRMARGGERYLAWEWPQSDVDFQPNDVCNGVKGHATERLT